MRNASQDTEFPEGLGPRYDFSSLSRGRLRAYNEMMEEFERLEGMRELDDDELAFLSAAGNPLAGQQGNGMDTFR